MSEGPEALREEIAASRGLDPRAAKLLTGTTLEEVEASADELVKLLDRGGREEEPTDLFASARADQARRKQALLTALAGRSEQPRDDRGRYGSFDGGARQPVPTPRDPSATHSELVSRLAAQSHLHGAADVADTSEGERGRGRRALLRESIAEPEQMPPVDPRRLLRRSGQAIAMG
jgi:hypothetical protein